jgi:hypothetical protein
LQVELCKELVQWAKVGPRGLHSSTFQLNLSRFGHTSLCPPCLIDCMQPTYPTKCAFIEPKLDECKPLVEPQRISLATSQVAD